MDFLTLQDKHNICTLSVNIKKIAFAAKPERKACQRLTFLPVSTTHKNYFELVDVTRFSILKYIPYGNETTCASKSSSANTVLIE